MNQLQAKIQKGFDELRNIFEYNGYKIPFKLNDYDYLENSNEVSKETKSLHNSEVITLFEEIEKFNDTVSKTSTGDIYTYYWKIEQLTSILAKWNMYIVSPYMLVLGIF